MQTLQKILFPLYFLGVVSATANKSDANTQMNVFSRTGKSDANTEMSVFSVTGKTAVNIQVLPSFMNIPV